MKKGIKSPVLVIPYWMIDELELKGNDLLTFALVFSFSADGYTNYRGGTTYLSKFLKIDKRSARRIISRLEGQDLIERVDVSTEFMEAYEFRVADRFVGGRTNEGLPQDSKGKTPDPNVPQVNNRVNNKVNNTLLLDKKNQTPPSPSFNWDQLLAHINKQTGRNFRVINDSAKRSFKARLKDGYKKVDIWNAIINAPRTEFHQGNKCQYLTPEYFSRAATLDKFGFKPKDVQKTPEQIRAEGGHVVY